MNPERWARIKSIFYDAAEKSADERAAFIRARTDGDESLALEIESLLDAHEQAAEFIEGTPDDAATAAMEVQLTDALVGSLIGNYEVIREIGRGGMGAVYLAEDTRLGRPVALKLLRHSFTTDGQHIRRFEQEARAASALNHPNIVTIYDIGEAEIGRFIVMEFIEGRTLREVAIKPLSLDDVLKVESQIAKALNVAHAAGIIHRDIKPENIMIRDDGYVKVLDFGVARLAPATAATLTGLSAAAETNPGVIIGTPAYMSPEQASGESLSGATDVFSSGIILYELTTGQHPFRRDSQVACLHAIIDEQPIPPSRLNPDIHPGLDALILQMLEKDPRLRPRAGDVDRIIFEIQKDSSHESSVDVRPRSYLAKRHSVGRERDRRDLHGAFDRITTGPGLMLSVAGEAGLGKTTLVEDFLADLAADRQSCVIARGQGSERLAGTEAYLPFLEMLESLLHSNLRHSIAQAMRHLAPTWYSQITPLSTDDSSGARLLAEAKGSSQERMKREMLALLQQISSERPMVIFLDDLQWADASTIDLLAYISTKLESLHALIVVTYRPSELLLSRHPFSQVKLELQGRGICHEIMLEFLTREDLQHYVDLEFPGHNFDREFVPLVYRKTEGNPLFMTDLVRFLRDRKVIAEENRHWVLAQSIMSLESEMPETVRSMIQRKIDQLSEEDRRLLIAASVQGYEFDSAVISKAMLLDPAEVEERLEVLERVFAFVRLIGEKEFPDKTLTQRHRFIHALYQNALYASLRPTRRALINKSVAEALIGYYGEKSSDVASELAYLFEAAREFVRAADYFLMAARRAVQLFAYREAAELARRGLSLLAKLPGNPELSRQELQLHLVIAFSFTVIKGYGAPETGKSFSRAREICLQIGENQLILLVLWGETAYHAIRAELSTAQLRSEELLQKLENTSDSIMLVGPLFALGFIFFYLGDYGLSLKYHEQAISVHDPNRNLTYREIFSMDPGIWSWGQTIGTLWALGYRDQSRQRIDEALNLAERASDARAIAFVLVFAAFHYRSCGEPEKVRELAEKCVALCEEHGISHEAEAIGIAYGWAIAQLGNEEEGIARIRESLAAHNARGSMISTSNYLAVLADTCARAGRITEASEAIAKAFDFVIANNERQSEAELYRLKGELLLVQAAEGENPQAHSMIVDAEACFQRAIGIARRQGAKSWELLTTLSLVRLWQKQDKKAEAREMLQEIYSWFTEGFETSDLKEARALLEELA